MTAADLDPLQLDLVCAVARLRQIRGLGADDGLGRFLIDRLLTCDLPRLELHLTAAAVEALAAAERPAPLWVRQALADQRIGGNPP